MTNELQHVWLTQYLDNYAENIQKLSNHAESSPSLMLNIEFQKAL